MDTRCIRALVRLYAAFPARFNADLTALALGKALALHPEPEFLQLLYLIPERAYTPTISALVEVDQLLHGAEWSRFWKRVEEADVQPVLNRVAGFADSVREYIFGAVNRTYSRIDVAVFAAALQLPPAGATAFAVSRGAGVEGEEVVLPVLADNSDRKRVEKADPTVLKPQEVASILSLLTR